MTFHPAMNDDFEHQLTRYNFGAGPDSLAETLFAAAKPHLAASRSTGTPKAWLARLLNPLRSLSPAALSLAAVWLVCLSINFLIGSGFRMGTSVALRPSPEKLLELRAQRSQLLELAGLREAGPERAPRNPQPRPHSELALPFTIHKT